MNSKPDKPRPVFRTLLAGASLALLGGCVLPPKAEVPMPAIWNRADSDTLVVFLPGRRDEPEDFLKAAFPETLTEAGSAVSTVIIDAHLGYYYERTLLERLQKDVLQPARAMGYEQIWAVGISLGGLGAVLVEVDAPGTWDGIVLIAPFTGDDPAVFEAIRSAPDLESVSLPREALESNYTAKFWIWMQEHLDDPSPPVFLGYGESDRMADEIRLLEQALPGSHVITIPGVHNWSTWEQVWEALCEILPELD